MAVDILTVFAVLSAAVAVRGKDDTVVAAAAAVASSMKN